MERTHSTNKADTKSNSEPPLVRKNFAHPSLSSPGGYIVRMQRTLGNQTVQRLYEEGKLQASLKIGRADDVFEREADKVADSILSMPDPAVQMKPG